MATARSDAWFGVIFVRGVKEKMHMSFPAVIPAVKVVMGAVEEMDGVKSNLRFLGKSAPKKPAAWPLLVFIVF